MYFTNKKDNKDNIKTELEVLRTSKMSNIYLNISISMEGNIKCIIVIPNQWEEDERKSSSLFVPYYKRYNLDTDIYDQYLPRISLINLDEQVTKPNVIDYEEYLKDDDYEEDIDMLYNSCDELSDDYNSKMIFNNIMFEYEYENDCDESCDENNVVIENVIDPV